MLFISLIWFRNEDSMSINTFPPCPQNFGWLAEINKGDNILTPWEITSHISHLEKKKKKKQLLEGNQPVPILGTKSDTDVILYLYLLHPPPLSTNKSNALQAELQRLRTDNFLILGQWVPQIVWGSEREYKHLFSSQGTPGWETKIKQLLRSLRW